MDHLRWEALLEAVEQESLLVEQDRRRQAKPGVMMMAMAYTLRREEEEDSDEGSQEMLLASRAVPSHIGNKGKRKREAATGRSNLPGGPCVHCGCTMSPQWRRPIDREHVLCNACGIFYNRHHKLPPHKKAAAPVRNSAPARPTPVVPARPTPQPQTTLAQRPAVVVQTPPAPPHRTEILLKPLPAVRTRGVKGPVAALRATALPCGTPASDEEQAPSDGVFDALSVLQAGDLRASAAAARQLAVAAGVGRPLSPPGSPSDSGLSSHHYLPGHNLNALSADTTAVVAATAASSLGTATEPAGLQEEPAAMQARAAMLATAAAAPAAPRMQLPAAMLPLLQPAAAASAHVVPQQLLPMAAVCAAGTPADAGVQAAQPILLRVLRCHGPKRRWLVATS